MQIENDYDKEVYNGDIGYIDLEAGELTASFDGRSVTFGFGELDTLVPAYAATIHKSQGSEYPALVIPLLTQHYAMLQRNLLYTGVTRGKRLVVLVGQKKAVAIAVKNVSGRRRWSKLREWLGRWPGRGSVPPPDRETPNCDYAAIGSYSSSCVGTGLASFPILCPFTGQSAE
jgi:exodeoxyribonuclease V alpha subunit